MQNDNPDLKAATGEAYDFIPVGATKLEPGITAGVYDDIVTDENGVDWFFRSPGTEGYEKLESWQIRELEKG